MLADDYLQKLEAILPTRSPETSASPGGRFRGCDDDFWFWLNTEGYRKSERLRPLLPSLPDEELQVRTIGSSGDAALKGAFDAYRLFADLFRKHSSPLGAGTRVLDFGCGWGRTLRFFLREVDQANLWGMDPNRLLIDACRRTNPWCQFVEGHKMPRSPFASGFFDLIYSYSVFSHLSEAAHRSWLAEIRRILRPGGVLIATTWQRDHIQRSEMLRKANPASLSGWQRACAAIWLENQQWLSEYDAGRFCYQPYPFETHPWSYHDTESYYGEACIPSQYVLHEWAQAFDVLEFIDDRNRCAQNVIAVRRRGRNHTRTATVTAAATPGDSFGL